MFVHNNAFEVLPEGWIVTSVLRLLVIVNSAFSGSPLNISRLYWYLHIREKAPFSNGLKGKPVAIRLISAYQLHSGRYTRDYSAAIDDGYR